MFEDQFKGTTTKAIHVRGNMAGYLLNEPDKVGRGDFNLRYLVAASFTNKTQDTGEIARFDPPELAIFFMWPPFRLIE